MIAEIVTQLVQLGAHLVDAGGPGALRPGPARIDPVRAPLREMSAELRHPEGDRGPWGGSPTARSHAAPN
ncbi:hypothetical protein PV439_30940 [Streptomyces scabiei]|uniref:hypothetical protein n=1 Tax=Streptomyces scabiei TaxID=1930 RepID=UPI0029AAF791|nr:hypothetical protein [Streptomyces scabiei]MDX2895712.1 hypothetical protein [Streptomyces scabiei]